MSILKCTFLVVVAFLGFSITKAQSFWLETGLAYTESLSDGKGTQSFEPFAKLGFRTVIPVNDTLGLYLRPFWAGTLGLDAGLWIDFPGKIQDLQGFNSFAGFGLSYLNVLTTSSSTGFSSFEGGLSLSLTGGISYDLTDTVAVSLSYSHYPILTPALSQAFDVSLGLRYTIR
ncbi:MAG: hypothetical protein KC422_12065 [Trueperaceae bacterium]|nr:hypothetical protein [Trueperaceae bacterium]